MPVSMSLQSIKCYSQLTTDEMSQQDDFRNICFSKAVLFSADTGNVHTNISHFSFKCAHLSVWPLFIFCSALTYVWPSNPLSVVSPTANICSVRVSIAGQFFVLLNQG